MRKGKKDRVAWTIGRKDLEELGRTVVDCGTAWE